MRHVTQDRDINADHFVNRGCINVDMRLGGFWGERIDAPRNPVVKARADIDHQITVVHRHVGLVKSVHPQHTQPFVARRGVGTKAHERGCDRKASGLDQFAQQLAGSGAGIDDAAAGIEHRPLGFFHRASQLGDRVYIAFDLRGVMALALGLFRIGARSELHVLGNIDQNGAGAARHGHVKRLMYDTGQFVGLFHQPVMFGAGARDTYSVGFLECIRTDHECRHLPRQHDNRDAVHQGVGQPGHSVGRTGARCHQRHAGFTSGPCIAFGGMHSTLFMAHQHVANFVLLKDLVIDR